MIVRPRHPSPLQILPTLHPWVQTACLAPGLQQETRCDLANFTALVQTVRKEQVQPEQRGLHPDSWCKPLASLQQGSISFEGSCINLGAGRKWLHCTCCRLRTSDLRPAAKSTVPASHRTAHHSESRCAR